MNTYQTSNSFKFLKVPTRTYLVEDRAKKKYLEDGEDK